MSALAVTYTGKVDKGGLMLKKFHHFFLRAMRCHLVSYFRVYPKITYQLPSFWSVSSAITPRYVVDTDGCSFRSFHQDRRLYSSLRSQHGRGILSPFDHLLSPYNNYFRSLPQQTSLTELTCDHLK